MKKRLSVVILFVFIIFVCFLVITSVPAKCNDIINSSETNNNVDIKISSDGITAGVNVYFGTYTSGLSYPVPWTVLSADVLIQSSAPVGSRNIPILSKYLLGNSIFRDEVDTGYYNFSTLNNVTSSSVLKTTMETLYSSSLFSSVEQRVILDATLNGDSMYSGQSDLENQKLFPLSYDEVYALGGSAWQQEIQTSTYINDPTGNSAVWRTRYCYDDYDAYSITESGFPRMGEHAIAFGVRPACFINSPSVLFNSIAVGGKQSGTVGPGALTTNSTVTGSEERKLTLIDNIRGSGRENFIVSTTSVQSTTEGGTVSIDYSGAKTGVNEYLSCFIMDNSNQILYYGRLKNLTTQSDASGSQSIIIPSGLTKNGYYTLELFNEEYNGDKKTDYSSSLAEVNLNIVEPVVVSPNSLDFGSLVQGYVNPQTLYLSLQNNLSTDILASEITVTSNTVSSAFDFSSSVGSILAGGSITYGVTPKTGLTAGNYNETLSFTRNNNAFATVNISLIVSQPTHAQINYTTLIPDTTLTAELVGETANSYQWQKYNTTSSVWEDIIGEAQQTLSVTGYDTGKQIRVKITSTQSVQYVSDAVTILAPTISVDVPLENVIKVECTGNCQLCNSQIVNNSTVDVYVSAISIEWNSIASDYFYDFTLITVNLTLGGGTGTSYLFSNNNWTVNPSLADGTISKNGGVLSTPWKYNLGTGNYIKMPVNPSDKTQVAKVVYTIDYPTPTP